MENHQATSIEERREQHREYEVGHRVAVRNYRNDQKWVSGTIQEKRGTRSYLALIEESAVWQRHSDQIRASDIIMVPSAVEVPVVDESTGTAVEAEEDSPPIPVQTLRAVNYPVTPAIPVQIPRAVNYPVRPAILVQIPRAVNYPVRLAILVHILRAVNYPVRPAILVQIPRAVDHSVRRSTRIRKSPKKVDL